MLWGSTSFDEANHHPVSRLKRSKDAGVLSLAAKAGETIQLDASPSADPDGDALSFDWFIYAEASTFDTVDTSLLSATKSARISFSVPKNAAGKSIHLILRVQDDEPMPLTSYKRIIIHIDH